MTMGPEDLGTGATATQEHRFTGQMGYRAIRRDAGTADPLGDGAAVVPSMDHGRPLLTDLDALAEPVFPTGAWLDQPGGTLADHPLLRGLLLELPPKGIAPPQAWLDRWFEAARSILELLYQDHSRR